MKNNPYRQAGFTLIEMLLVITIIVILAGLLLGGINMAIRRAEIQKAQTSAFQLATAFRLFQSEYGTWPPLVSNPGPVTNSVVDYLTKQDPTYNTRGIVFLEVDQKSVKDGPYKDPWGTPYQVQCDTNYTGSLTTQDGKTVPVGVVVWSTGPKGSAAPASEWVKTW